MLTKYVFTWLKYSSIYFIAIMLFNNCVNRTILIKPLHPYEYRQNDTIIDGQKISNGLAKYYFIENYSHDSLKIKQVEQFVFRHLPENYKKYEYFNVIIYRKTNVLNDKYRDSEQDELAWHDKDQLFDFIWYNGKYSRYFEYKDGDCLNCPELDIR
ncbi:MAG: hypothetical protein QM768_07395 [Agriterribacter sp.]